MRKRIYDLEQGVDIKLYDIAPGIKPDVYPEPSALNKAKRTLAEMQIGDSFVVPGATQWFLRGLYNRGSGRIYSMRQREFGVRVWRHA